MKLKAVATAVAAMVMVAAANSEAEGQLACGNCIPYVGPGSDCSFEPGHQYDPRAACWIDSGGHCRHTLCVIDPQGDAAHDEIREVETELGVIRASRVKENLFAGWRRCSGMLALVAEELPDGTMILRDVSEFTDRPEFGRRNLAFDPISGETVVTSSLAER